MLTKERRISSIVITKEAADLLSEDGENPEYDRAIVEMTTRLLGLSHDFHDTYMELLREIKTNG